MIDVDRDLMWWGEDGERIAAQGHLDLAEFAKAADALARRGQGPLPDDELPSAGFDAEHEWYRPITREWFGKHYPDDDEDFYNTMLNEGWLEACSADDPGAEPWTTIETGS